jgi:hypothetical protein
MQAILPSCLGALDISLFCFLSLFLFFEINPCSIQSQQRKANKEKDAKIEENKQYTQYNSSNDRRKDRNKTPWYKIFPPTDPHRPSIHPSIHPSPNPKE